MKQQLQRAHSKDNFKEEPSVFMCHKVENLVTLGIESISGQIDLLNISKGRETKQDNKEDP